MMRRHTLQDLLHRTMTGEETFYIASEFDPLVKLWTDQEAVIAALRIDLAGRDKRIEELTTALRAFALAHGDAAAYVRTFELAKPMDRRDLFMWQAGRRLCVDDYVAAAKTYGGQTMFGL